MYRRTDYPHGDARAKGKSAQPLAAPTSSINCLTALGVGNAEVPKGAVILTAMVKSKPGQEDAVKNALVSLVEPTRKEPGCLCYNLHQSKADPTQFMFYEQWASKEDLDAHGKTPHMRALGGKLKDRTDKGGGVVLYELLK